MTSVPRTVPSTPLSVMASSRQIIRNEAATNRARNHQGAHVPVLSIQVMNAFNRGSLARGLGCAKAQLRKGPVEALGARHSSKKRARQMDSACYNVLNWSNQSIGYTN